MISRHWAMPNKRTFAIKPIRDLMPMYGFAPTFDAFPFGPEIDVLERIKAVESDSQMTVILDPPYSPRQAKECYGLKLDAVSFSRLVRRVKDECARIIRPGGYVISCGWNSNGLGINRGFRQVEIRLIAHGGNHNDTIVTVEQKHFEA
jgi:hypothetical protein